MIEAERIEAMLSELGECKLREDLRDALGTHGERFVADLLDDYFLLDEADRNDVHAFHDCGGVKMVADIKVKHADGTPTSKDLEEWV